MGCSSSREKPHNAQENSKPRPIAPPQRIPTQSTKPRPPTTRVSTTRSQRPRSSYNVDRRRSKTSYGDVNGLSRSRSAFGDGGRHLKTSHGDSRRYSRPPDLGASPGGIPATAHGWPTQTSPRQPIPQRIPTGLSTEFTEDRAITGRASYLSNRIFQHSEYYYHRDVSVGQFRTPELHDNRSRHAAIRQELARRIIESVVLSQVPRSDAEIIAFSSQAAEYLAPYAKPSTDGAREDHLLVLFRLGAELRELISLHPSKWMFGGWDSVGWLTSGFMMVFPALLKDSQEVMREETFRVRMN